METSIKGKFYKEKNKAMECIHIPMEIYIKGFGRRIRKVEVESMSSQIRIFTRVSFKKEQGMAKEYSNAIREISMKGSFIKEAKTAKEY